MCNREEISRLKEYNYQMSIVDPARTCDTCPEFDTFSDEALHRLCRCYGINLRNRKKMIRKLEDCWGMYHLEGMEASVPEFNPFPGKTKPTASKPTLKELATRSCSSREYEEATRRQSAIGHQPEKTPLPSTRAQQASKKKGVVMDTVANLEAAITQLQKAKQQVHNPKVTVVKFMLIYNVVVK